MDYTHVFLNHPNLDPLGIFSIFLLILMRLGPIIAMAPFLAAKLAPPIAKVGFAICLTTIFLPFVALQINEPISFNNAFIGYSLKEILIGFFLGFLISIPFYIVQASGVIIDYLRGASIMQAQDPTMQTQASPIGILFNSLLIVIFFQIRGPIIFFNSLLESYNIVPANKYINPLFFNANNSFWKIVFDLGNQVLTLALQLAAPCLVAILMAEMFLGIANRLAPQVQIAFLGMSIKSFLGLSLLWIGLSFLLIQFSKHLDDWLQLTTKLIQYMKFTY